MAETGEGSCVFCRIVAGELEARRVREDALALAFHDVDPKAPVHVLVVPRRHVPGLDAAAAERDLLGHLLRFAVETAAEQGLAGRGYRVVVNSGEEAGQSVPHLHLHVLGGRRLAWPPG